jgi:type III pantothenate kinase
MYLAIDIGNTAVKWGTFDGATLKASGMWQGVSDAAAQLRSMPADSVDGAMMCTSGDRPEMTALFSSLPYPVATLSSDTALPVRLDYRTPETLGADRVAAACGAWALHTGENCLVIDAGTCITVDFVGADGTYHGGAIMPGLQMNLRALHTFTAKLPLVSVDGVRKAPVAGRSTEESIVAGTLGATMLALAGYVALYRQRCPQLQVLLTGGDAQRLVDAGATGWELQPHLTLIGLNLIIQHNEK